MLALPAILWLVALVLLLRGNVQSGIVTAATSLCIHILEAVLSGPLSRVSHMEKECLRILRRGRTDTEDFQGRVEELVSKLSAETVIEEMQRKKLIKIARGTVEIGWRGRLISFIEARD